MINPIKFKNNFNDINYELVEIINRKAMFTQSRINKYTIPDDLYKYELREMEFGFSEDYDDEDPEEIIINWGEVSPSIIINFKGTLLFNEKLNSERINLDEDTSINYLGQDITYKKFKELF